MRCGYTLKPKLIIILLLLVMVPLGLLTWLGSRLIASQRVAVERSFLALQQAKLADVETTISKVLARREQRLVKLGGSLSLTAEAMRETVRSEPWIRQVFLLDRDGKLLHPSPAGPLSMAERTFINRAGQIFDDRDVFLRPAGERPGERPAQADHGWYTWYWRSGLNILLWQRLGNGAILGFELDRFRLIADIISELPDTRSPASLEARLTLTDSRDRVLYQWGDYNPGENEAPATSLALAAPLKPWHLAIYTGGVSPSGVFDSGTQFFLILGLCALGLALLGLAIYFYRESSRELRDAGQRVSFVNHVSHELKTPLTNIRMYAELLQEHLGGEDQRASRHLEVVVSESQRLSRLIDNVLTFSRHQRGTLKLRKLPGVVDEIIGRLLEQSARALSEKNIEFDFERGAPRRVLLDEDVLRQIINNLLTNVEKYAPGGRLTIRTSQAENRTRITVADSGPGVPASCKERVFEPFFRLGSAVSEGAAGTGIGLSIARDLARLHGGDLELVPSDSGAVFEMTLVTETESQDESADCRR